MGEPLPFDDVCVLYRDAVYRYCLTQVRPSAHAEDVAAEVFEAAWVAYDRVRPDPDTVHLWLFRIAKNRAANHRRRSLLLSGIVDRLSRTSVPSAQVEGEVVMREELRTALAAVAALKKRERELIGLRAAAGLSYGEIGQFMGMSERAALVATRRAMEKVRHAVEEVQ